jgi:hypothetical protein
MRPTRITCIILVFVLVLGLAFSLPAGAFNGASASAYGGTGLYPGVWDGSWGGGWNQGGLYQGGVPYQQWQNPVWDNQYPFWSDYRGQGYFSNCYSRCIAQGYGTNYCAQVCPV